MTPVNHVRWALSTPADKALRERISHIIANFDEYCREMAARKIDVGQALGAKKRLAQAEWRRAAPVGIKPHDDAAIRALKLDMRVQMLALMDEEDAWNAAQAAKKAKPSE